MTAADPFAFPAAEDCYRYDGTLGCEAVAYADAVAASKYRCRRRRYGGDLDDVRQSARLAVVALAATVADRDADGKQMLPFSKLAAAVDAAVDAEIPWPSTAADSAETDVVVDAQPLPALVDADGVREEVVADRADWVVDAEAAAVLSRFRNTVELHAGGDGLKLLLRHYAVGESVEEIAKSRCNRVTKVTPERVRRELEEAKAKVAAAVPLATVERMRRLRHFRETARGRE